MRRKPRIYKRGNTWWCVWDNRYGWGDTWQVAWGNFIGLHGTPWYARVR